MPVETSLTRSVLYIPASKERALEKARGLETDAIIFDLEDAVAPDEKETARAVLRKALTQGGYGSRLRIVRINGAETEWGKADIEALKTMDFDAVLLPKVENAADISNVNFALPDIPVWAMIETPKGILNAEEIAAHPALEGFVMGTNDLAKELRCRFRADRLPLMGALQSALLAARAHGVIAIDGVYNAFKDDAGLALECEQGRDLGFDGKTLIHPAQLATANRVFSPSAAEVDLANRQIEAYETAEAVGQGVAVVDGKIVENLHVVTARQIISQAKAIAEAQE
ncbi:MULTISPECIES: HpcH/HpaI aldolase/citrate lyase family protein [Falsihalocynthiibacter]|uniref:HpcH/HpaI aldolase/citrate lyase family protein n=1 Tax=Falsihalocynthiibacter TaxID=2854182 RepID=UPI0030014F9A